MYYVFICNDFKYLSNVVSIASIYLVNVEKLDV